MDNAYYVVEIKKRAQHKVFLFEVEKDESLDEVVARNFGDDAIILKYRVPTMEERILMQRGMKS